MRLPAIVLFSAICFGFLSCNDNTANSTNPAPAASESMESPIPQKREKVTPGAIQSYSEDLGGLNNWKFKVELFETPKTFSYFIKIQYQEVRGTDTIVFPNFGIPPRPVLKKGPDELTCILGFLDGKDNFREFKKIAVEKGDISLKTLRRYSTPRYKSSNQ